MSATQAHAGKPSPHRATLLLLAARPEGASVDDAARRIGITPRAVGYLFTAMIREGKLFREHGWQRGRVFASAEAAIAQARPLHAQVKAQKTARWLDARHQRDALVHGLADRADGIDAAELAIQAGISHNAACADLIRRNRRGQLHRARGPMATMRYFATAEAAAAYEQRRMHPPPVERPAPKPAAKPARKREAVLRAPRNPKPLPKHRANGLTIKPATRPLPDLNARAAPGPVIVPPHVRVQVLPSSPTYGRHAVDPNTRIADGFAAMGVGRYLEEPRTP